MKKLLFYVLAVLLFVNCNAQGNSIKSNKIFETKIQQGKPKLVVGIVVDQMRYDYLTRFENKYGNGGFKRLINEGFNCKNNHFNYIPTYTGPGHASIYTGTTPKYHGIISNNWFDKEIKKIINCVSDTLYEPVGTKNSYSKVSPQKMKVSTVTDELRMATQMKGKVIGIAIKDRGAALPAGHSANGAYWFQGGQEGNWVTSTFYMNELPKWVEKFNNSETAENYFKTWNTFYKIDTYGESGLDQNDFEGGFKGKPFATFPYELAKLKDFNNGFDLLKSTPFGNNLTTDFALAAIDGEELGKDDITDFLTVSYSSTDYIGHNFGVNSKEIEDTYIRLDKDIERFLNYLDEKVGKGEYTVFLTSDHGAVDVPAYLQSINIPADYFNSTDFKSKLNEFVTKKFRASDLIESISNNQVFLDRSTIDLLELDLEDVQEAIVNEIINYKHIDKAFTATTMGSVYFDTGIEAMLQMGFNQKRSGDVLYVFDPAVLSYSKTGSQHGSGFNYDTHVPLLFYGYGIKKGSTTVRTEITDLAPTISALLNISFPNAATGKPINFVLD
jgi:predicted AlkP superfamily pyrophosphatase or phosphodiesterase